MLVGRMGDSQEFHVGCVQFEASTLSKKLLL